MLKLTSVLIELYAGRWTWRVKLMDFKLCLFGVSYFLIFKLIYCIDRGLNNHSGRINKIDLENVLMVFLCMKNDTSRGMFNAVNNLPNQRIYLLTHLPNRKNLTSVARLSAAISFVGICFTTFSRMNRCLMWICLVRCLYPSRIRRINCTSSITK